MTLRDAGNKTVAKLLSSTYTTNQANKALMPKRALSKRKLTV
jgi:hypothetical protein